jgi:erythrocyte band 7 integral membrane protein
MLGSCIGNLGAVPCCIICPNPYKSVAQGNVGLVTKFGRFYRAVDPGLVKINPLSERLTQVDVKIQIVGMLRFRSMCEAMLMIAQRYRSKFA